MNNILILGAGTGGTMLANLLASQLPQEKWRVTVVDKSPYHYFQPGLLYIPFGKYNLKSIKRPHTKHFRSEVNFIAGEVEVIEPEHNRVKLTYGDVLEYDHLVIATGARIVPGETPGMLGEGWGRNIFDFYTPEGAVGLCEFMAKWKGGRLVLNVAEMPIKCPVAPLEFLFLADEFFRRRGIRDKVEIVYAPPTPEVFTKPTVVPMVNELMEEKNIRVETDYYLMEVDPGKGLIRSYDNREIEYDLLVSIPTNMGASFIEHSGMGDEFHFLPADDHTLLVEGYENIWALGDAAETPCPKTGSSIHGMCNTMAVNIPLAQAGKPLKPLFFGGTTCLVEVGDDKAVMLSFSYNQDPAPGRYPHPKYGPLTKMAPTWINHIARRTLKWQYFNLYLKDRFTPPYNGKE